MILPFLLLVSLCAAHPSRRETCALPRIRPLSQFPVDTWVENIAVRSNGQLLVTLFTTPELYQIDPFETNPIPKLVAQFPEALGILGIAEIEKDVFAITKGNFSTAGVVPQSYSLWKADLTNPKGAVISKIVDIPEATVLNGATTVKEGSKFVLIADSLGGAIFRVNVQTAKYDVILNNTATQPNGTFDQGGWGANGVHTRDGFLFFTNSNYGFYRVPIHDDGTPAGDVQLLTSAVPNDDFTFDAQGNAFVARGAVHLLDKITPAGKEVSLKFENADADVLIDGNTAVHFGRTTSDKSTLYVTTNGGMSGRVDGTAVQGGRVLAIDLGHK